MGDKEDRWQRAAGEEGRLPERSRAGAASNGWFLKVTFESVDVQAAASADESATLTLPPLPERDPG